MKKHAWTRSVYIDGGFYCLDCLRSGPKHPDGPGAWNTECGGQLLGRTDQTVPNLDHVRAQMAPQQAAWNRVQVAVGFAWDAIPLFEEVAARVEAICEGRGVISKANPATEKLQAENAKLREDRDFYKQRAESQWQHIKMLEREQGPGIKPEPAPITCDMGAYWDE